MSIIYIFQFKKYGISLFFTIKNISFVKNYTNVFYCVIYGWKKQLYCKKMSFFIDKLAYKLKKYPAVAGYSVPFFVEL